MNICCCNGDVSVSSGGVEGSVQGVTEGNTERGVRTVRL